MWGLRPSNWKHFCDTDDEHHAVAMGLFFMPWMWWLIVKYGASSEASRLMTAKPWYVALGGWVQFWILNPLVVIGLFCLVKGVL